MDRLKNINTTMRTKNKHLLKTLMRSPLLPITSQKRLLYRPSKTQVYTIYEALNEVIFNNSLYRPIIELRPRRREHFGMCCGLDNRQDTGSYCRIVLMDKWCGIQSLITILAHEMVHQHQWDIYSIKREAAGQEAIMSHGPSFFKFKTKLARYHIQLKTAYRY